jgi:hypothetical protein
LLLSHSLRWVSVLLKTGNGSSNQHFLLQSDVLLRRKQ